LRARIRQVNSEQADDLRIVQTASDDLKHRSSQPTSTHRQLWNISVAHLIGLDVGRPDHPDVNADGKADIVGFGADGVYMALATGGGHFASPTAQLSAFAANAGGWNSDNAYPRQLADINGNGSADIVGFAANGVWTAPSLT
jgi:hypothetical protein